ncbi:MAG: GC-type dockerin domain-anchored protein [Phycisphaerales bacterium JB039]
MRRIVTLLAVSGLALPALADIGDPCENFVTQTITRDNRSLGIEYAWGYFWVTGAGVGGSGPEFQRIYQFDGCWNLIETYPQQTTSEIWGGRDPAAVEDENLLYIGTDLGEWSIYTYDPATERLDTTQTVTEFTFLANTIRALAYRPSSDSFFTKDFGGGISELDRTGFELDFWSLPDVSAYGAAYDPLNDTIWFNAYCGDPCIAAGNGTTLFEWDPDLGDVTGRIIDMQDPKYAPDRYRTWIPGGLDAWVEGDQLVFVAHNQGDPRDFAIVLLGDGTGGCPELCPTDCYADCDESGSLDFFDFLCFQNAFAGGDPYADCDGSGSLDFFDFLCFQNEFAAGCP